MKIPYGILLQVVGDPHALFEGLAVRLGGQLATLTLTDNRRTMFSARPAQGGQRGTQDAFDLRIHHRFTTAPPEVLDSVAALLRENPAPERRRHLARVRAFFEESAREAPHPPRRRRAHLNPKGAFHDLEEIRDEVHQEYFPALEEVPITWGRALPRAARPSRFFSISGKSRRRSIHLGTYNGDLHLIRIHRALDQRWVPRVVVASVVHHELLHAAMPAETVRGRRRLHPPEFRRRERLFHGYGEAKAWIEENLPRLLAARG